MLRRIQVKQCQMGLARLGILTGTKCVLPCCMTLTLPLQDAGLCNVKIVCLVVIVGIWKHFKVYFIIFEVLYNIAKDTLQTQHFI